MSYTCEICGTEVTVPYGSSRFCGSVCAKRYSSLKSKEAQKKRKEESLAVGYQESRSTIMNEETKLILVEEKVVEQLISDVVEETVSFSPLLKQTVTKPYKEVKEADEDELRPDLAWDRTNLYQSLRLKVLKYFGEQITDIRAKERLEKILNDSGVMSRIIEFLNRGRSVASSIRMTFSSFVKSLEKRGEMELAKEYHFCKKNLLNFLEQYEKYPDQESVKKEESVTREEIVKTEVVQELKRAVENREKRRSRDRESYAALSEGRLEEMARRIAEKFPVNFNLWRKIGE